MTTLQDRHHAAAERVRRDGYEVAAYFAAPHAEAGAATTGAAVADRSYLGRLTATGADVLDLFHRISTNRVDPLPEMSGAPTVFTTERGRVVDAVQVFKLPSRVLVLTSAGAQGAVRAWIDKYTIAEDIALADASASTAQITLLGVGAKGALMRAMGGEPPVPWGAREGAIAGRQVVVLGTVPLGQPGYDLVVASEDALAVWDALVEAGAAPVGESTVEWLRVSGGWPRYGMEIGEAFNPLEAGLRGAVSFNKGCYIGQEVVARLDAYDKVQRALVRLTLTGQAEPGAPLRADGQRVGEVTSVARAPDGAWVALGYVRATLTAEETAFDAGNGVTARVAGVALPYGRERD